MDGMDTEEALSRFDAALRSLDQGRGTKPFVFWGLSGTGRTDALQRMYSLAGKLAWTAVVADALLGESTTERVRMGLTSAVDQIRIGRPGSLAVRSVGEQLAISGDQLSVSAMVRLVGVNLEEMRARLCLLVDDLEPSPQVTSLMTAAEAMSGRGLPMLVVCCLAAPMEVEWLDEVPELARLHASDVRVILDQQAGGSADEAWVQCALDMSGGHAGLAYQFAGLIGDAALTPPGPGDVERCAARFRLVVADDLHHRTLAGLDRADRRFLRGLVDLGGRKVPLRAIAQRIGDVTPLRRDTALTEQRARSLAQRGLVAINDVNEIWVNPPYLVDYGAALD